MAEPAGATAKPRVVLGLAGGSGSGKSWLARAIESSFPGKVAVVCHDWWYRHNAGLPESRRRRLNFDHPKALETSLMVRQLDRLVAGEPIEAPCYDYASHSRLAQTRRVEPKPIVVLDGILILAEPAVRERLTHSVFIDTPDDVRLVRRVRRDTLERRVDLAETLRLYEDFVRPMHKKFVQPSARHATWIWAQLEDRTFPRLLIKDLKRRLSSAE